MNVVRSVTSGSAVAEALEEQALVARARPRPAHPLEDAVGGVLERQVDVADDLVAGGDRLDGLVGDRRRVEVEQPDPGDAVDLVQLAQEPGEGAALAAVDAVERSSPAR